MRLGLAAPFVIVAIVATRRDAPAPMNQALLDSLDVVRSGGADLDRIDAAYPPLPTLIALVAPTLIGLGIAGAAFAGVLGHAVAERLHHRHVPLWLIGVLLVSSLGPPVVWYGVVASLPIVGALTFLTLALSAFVRFTFSHKTEGGFVAGLALAGAFLCSDIAIAYAVTLGLAAPFLAHYRFRAEPGAARATIAVLCFPTVALYLSWSFLAWRFSGGTFGHLPTEPDIYEFPHGIWGGIADALGDVGQATLRCPIYLVVGALWFSRRAIALAGLALPLLTLVTIHAIGMYYSEIGTVVLLSLVAMASIPSWPTPRTQAVLAAAAALQLVVNVAWPPTSAGSTQWLHVMFGG